MGRTWSLTDSVWDFKYHHPIQNFCFVFLIGIARCHIQMIRLQFRCLLSQKSIQSFLRLCNAPSVIFCKQSAFLHLTKLSPLVGALFPLRATSHCSYLLLKGYFKVMLGTFPYMAAATRSNKSVLFGSCSLALQLDEDQALINNRLCWRPTHSPQWHLLLLILFIWHKGWENL